MVRGLDRVRRVQVGYLKDPIAPFGRCIVCDGGLWNKPLVYHGTGPLCWGCWSKLKRGTLHVESNVVRPAKPSFIRRLWNWLTYD